MEDRYGERERGEEEETLSRFPKRWRTPAVPAAPFLAYCDADRPTRSRRRRHATRVFYLARGSPGTPDCSHMCRACAAGPRERPTGPRTRGHESESGFVPEPGGPQMRAIWTRTVLNERYVCERLRRTWLRLVARNAVYRSERLSESLSLSGEL